MLKDTLNKLENLEMVFSDYGIYFDSENVKMYSDYVCDLSNEIEELDKIFNSINNDVAMNDDLIESIIENNGMNEFLRPIKAEEEGRCLIYPYSDFLEMFLELYYPDSGQKFFCDYIQHDHEMTTTLVERIVKDYYGYGDYYEITENKEIWFYSE